MPAFLIISAIVAAASAAYGGYAAHQSAKTQEKVADYNEKMAEGSRRIEQEKRKRDTRRRIAAAQAQYASSGLAITGSAVDVLADAASEEAYTNSVANRNWLQRVSQFGIDKSSARSQQRGAIIGGGLSKGAAATSGYVDYKKYG